MLVICKRVFCNLIHCCCLLIVPIKSIKIADAGGLNAAFQLLQNVNTLLQAATDSDYQPIGTSKQISYAPAPDLLLLKALPKEELFAQTVSTLQVVQRNSYS